MPSSTKTGQWMIGKKSCDETKINRIGSDGHQYVWKKAREPLSDSITQPTVKHGGGNMVWGYIWVGMKWECLLRLREGWILHNMWTSWISICPRAFKIWRIQQMRPFSSKIMIQSTPPRWHKNGFLKIRLRY